MEVMAVNEARGPLLAALAGGRWQIVDAEGEPIGEPESTPYLAWKSAAEKVKVAA
jgi:hypothetical protein